jgi:large subunit ribosomal protein L17
MRHRKPRHRLARPADQRKAVLRALATELLRHDEIVTTFAKAKAVQPKVERLITLAKKGYVHDPKDLKAKADNGDTEAAKKVARSLHLHRQAGAYLYDKAVVTRVFDEIAPRYVDRHGGYTRILRAGPRRGDATPMAIIQLV